MLTWLCLLFLPEANEGRNDYHPMFFTHDRAFEELFAICIQLLNKTWKEMRATAEDFNKVRVENRYCCRIFCRTARVQSAYTLGLKSQAQKV